MLARRPSTFRAVLGPLALCAIVPSCSSGEASDPSFHEPVGEVASELTKGNGGVNCDYNFCYGSVLCGLGEGDCASNAQCDQTTAAGPLRCVQNNGAKWGCSAGTDVCAPAHCTNKRLDPGETQVDCGGPCGPICPQTCVGLPANGLPGHCSIDCPCPAGEGDCNGTTTCVQNGPLGALVCPAGNGTKFGFSSAIELCVPTHCTNRVLDAGLGETQVDCGGPCGTVCSSVCGQQPPSGATGHCTTSCPCNFKDGDCDLASQCVGGGSCLQDKGELFGFSANTDVCVAAHCNNGVIDGGELGLDCGGPDCATCAGTIVDATSFAGSGPDYAQLVRRDAAGNLYVAWRYASSPFNIGLGDVGNAGNFDILLAKFSPQGTPLWNRRLGNSGADGDYNAALAVDANGNVFFGANYYDTLNVGGSDMTMSGVTDFYVAKFDSAGNHLWSRSFGGPNLDRLRKIEVDPSGNPVLIGFFMGSITFGADAHTSSGHYDAFVAKLSGSDGAPLWSHRYGSTAEDRCSGIAIDGAGGIYVAGQVGGGANLGTGPVATSNNSVDAFLIKLDPSGTTTAVTTFGGTTRGDVGATVGVDSSQRPIMVGSFTSDIDFGAGVFNPDFADVFVIAYDTNLNRRWAKHFGGPGYDYSIDSAVSASGELVMAGFFSESIDLGNGSVMAKGQRDIFALRYSASGDLVWSRTFGGAGYTETMSLALGANSVFVSGYYEQTVAFDTFSLGPATARDSFLIQLGF